ncbi:proto-oncogene Mas-like [Carassius auratus]|uniref:Proto-oncogene Mas-like n=1 Tax=Carassius auratus TaxID=7957 RepID=A0A6P6KJW9_CARAU|nr:proto-oncogene Mas-like [Carassius auratus]XP_026072559.1 proto-oncogene Mas-like [Carassius auratus]
MVYTGTSSNRTFQLEMSQFPWEMDELNLTFLEKILCGSTFETVVIWIIFSIEFLVMSLAFYGLCRLISPNHPVPVFIINLFITDVIHICFRPILNVCTFSVVIAFIYYIYSLSIIVNVGFMVCISVERYIMIKYPVWYRLHNTSQNLSLICLLVWAISCGIIVIDVIIALHGNVAHAFFVIVFVLLIPYPLVMFSFVGSWKALSHSVAITPNEQKKILGILALVLFSYTVLFMPVIVQGIIMMFSFEQGLRLIGYLLSVSGILVYLNPLADSFLYVFLRRDANSMFKCLCCEKLHENQIENSSNSLSRRGEVQISIIAYRETTELESNCNFN